MFSEMQSFAKANPDVPTENILQMATINGARDLGMQNQMGELTARWVRGFNRAAFFVEICEAHEAILQHTGEVFESIIGDLGCETLNWIQVFLPPSHG